jgi:predicted metalloprotease with PDZ domain
MTVRRLATIALVLAVGGLVHAGAAPGEASPGGEASEGHAWLGVFLGDEVDGGVHVSAVVPGGPAARGGLVSGDVVVQADGLRVLTVRDLTRLLDRARPGAHLDLRLLRSGKTVRCLVNLGERPSSTALLRRVAPSAPPAPRAPLPPAGTPAPRAGCASYGLVLADVTPDLRRYFGAPETAGVLVTGIAAGRPASLDGFRVGDILVRLGGEAVHDAEDVERVLVSRREEALTASLIRARRAQVVTVRAPHVPAPEEHARSAGTEWIEIPVLAGAGEDDSAAREALDRAVRLEIERLEKRIEQLKRQLESLEDESE